jgi:hypothetical protein
MTYRDAVFAGAVFALGATGAAAMASFGQLPYGGQQVQAEAVGFDALAHRMFGTSGEVTCTARADIGTAGNNTRQLH